MISCIDEHSQGLGADRRRRLTGLRIHIGGVLDKVTYEYNMCSDSDLRKTDEQRWTLDIGELQAIDIVDTLGSHIDPPRRATVEWYAPISLSFGHSHVEKGDC